MAKPKGVSGEGDTGQNPIESPAELRQMREDHGIKLYWMAKQMGVDPSHLSLMETGKRKWLPKRIVAFKRVLGE